MIGNINKGSETTMFFVGIESITRESVSVDHAKKANGNVRAERKENSFVKRKENLELGSHPGTPASLRKQFSSTHLIHSIFGMNLLTIVFPC